MNRPDLVGRETLGREARRTFLHVLARRALAEDLGEPPLQRLLLLLVVVLRSRRIRRRRRGAVVVGISGIHCAAVLTRSRHAGIAWGIGPGGRGTLRGQDRVMLRRRPEIESRRGAKWCGEGLGRGLSLSLLSVSSPRTKLELFFSFLFHL